MNDAGSDVGMVGLGVMGRNLVLNIADHGFSVAGYDLSSEQAQALMHEKREAHAIQTAPTLKELAAMLRRPRAVILLVPAGRAVDGALDALLPHLEPGDLVIDSGNSHFTDTDRRGKALSERGFLFMGMGISGGEAGARHGPSLMPGGPREAYERVKAILESAAARVDDEPCVTYLGSGSVGHYVKMVHNGIEYGLMELIAETYALMKLGLGLDADRLHEIYEQWDRTELNSYLMEITARVFGRRDEETGAPLVDRILDRAKQKGTGKWTSWDAMELQIPTPTIDAAVMMRNLSSEKARRLKASEMLHGPEETFRGDGAEWIEQIRNALACGMILTFAQGMALLHEASSLYSYGLDLEAVARIWRGGCIIRAALLREIRSAYRNAPDLANLLLDPHLAREVESRQAALRRVVANAVELGVPVPGFMASLAYFDAIRSGWLPANLIQAQRDYFGAHTYERTDKEGIFHTQWETA